MIEDNAVHPNQEERKMGVRKDAKPERELRLRDEVKKLRSQLTACVMKYSEAVIEVAKLREELKRWPT